MTQPKVLVVEDEPSIRGFVTINLKRSGYEVIEAASAEEALQLLRTTKDIAVALLDVMLPGQLDGFDICASLRSTHPNIGIIMLTAKGQDNDKIKGLQLGADDYMTKPFSPAELIARIQSLLRRLHRTEQADLAPDAVQTGPFVMSASEHRLTKNGEEIVLTPTEFDIVKLLMESLNRSVSRDDILNQVWGKHFVGDLKIVDVNIRRIRQKIEDDPSSPKYIGTVWGYGYVWKKEAP
jgi:DNA-binding response OmpR family regulator